MPPEDHEVVVPQQARILLNVPFGDVFEGEAHGLQVAVQPQHPLDPAEAVVLIVRAQKRALDRLGAVGKEVVVEALAAPRVVGVDRVEVGDVGDVAD